MKRPILFVVALAVTAVAGVGFVACGSSGGTGHAEDGGSDATNPDAGQGADGSSGSDAHVFGDGPLGEGSSGDGAGSEGSAGEAGPLGDSGVFNGDGGCFTLATACNANADCCSGDCSNHVCTFPSCTGDGLACGPGTAACCSLDCVGGTCAALNPSCSTIGNPCGTAPDGGALPACCSDFCSAGRCQQPSFCVQTGDSCATGTDCCSGICTKTGTEALGICAGPPGGPANCGLTDGMLCAGTAADGGVVVSDAGVPACGGACCSRACAPWGPTGVPVCQPASACHPVGDVCLTDADCCGSSGLPGGSTKPVTCDMTGGGPVGICTNPMGCKPNGDVCKLATSSCNSSCDCCAGNCETEDTCKQDNVGVPRCTGAQCLDAGSACASSADCCNGNPCVPTKMDGGPEFTCYPFQCVQSCGACTNNADCCPGYDCLNGTCDPCGGGTPGDGGAPGDGSVGGPDGSGLPPDGGAPPPPDGGCASYGQICSSSGECCDSVPCTGGRCEYPIQ